MLTFISWFSFFLHFFRNVFCCIFSCCCCCSATFRGHKHVRVAIQYGQLLLSLCPPHTHTHGQGQEHTCFPQRSLLLEKLNLAFCNLTKKKAEEKRQQWGEREGEKEKNEARSKLCFLFSFDFFFAFFLLVWHVLSCLSFCFARVIFLSFSAQREIHLAHMTTTAAAARRQQQLDEHKLQNGCQRNQKENQGAGPKELKGKAT